MRRTATAALLLGAMLLPLGAAESDWVSAADLRRLIVDTTITGRYDNGEPYSEYHAPDGRVLGHNNRVPNEEACWDVKGDSVCYYYAKGRALGEFCWRFQRLGGAGIRARSTTARARSSACGRTAIRTDTRTMAFPGPAIP